MRILTLISKFPWPLTDGAVIRDFNLLRETAKRHEVFLLCFLFKPSDREQFDALRPFCKKIVGLDLVRTRERTLVNIARSLVTADPFIIREYWRPEMAHALEKFVDEEHIDVIHSHFLHMSASTLATNGTPPSWAFGLLLATIGLGGMVAIGTARWVLAPLLLVSGIALIHPFYKKST